MRNSEQVVSAIPILALVGILGATKAGANDTAAESNARQAHEAYTTAINSNNIETFMASPRGGRKVAGCARGLELGSGGAGEVAGRPDM